MVYLGTDHFEYCALKVALWEQLGAVVVATGSLGGLG